MTKMLLPDAPTARVFGPYEEAPGLGTGTVLLFDPALQAGAFSGIPADNATIPNVAADNAAAIVGQAASGLHFTHSFLRESTDTLVMERTAKGGLHGIASQVAQTTSGNYARLLIPFYIRQYLAGLVPGDVGWPYFCAAIKITRAQIGSPPLGMIFIGSNNSVNAYLMRSVNGAIQGAQTTGQNSITKSGVILSSTAPTAWTGTKTASFFAQMYYAGADPYQGGSFINKGTSSILYYFKAENLKLANRANFGAGGTAREEYAEAWALDKARLINRFSEGGVWYSDTYTDPTELP